jgi:hypothetical protein
MTPRTHCLKGNHEYTCENTRSYVDPSGQIVRKCRECERIKSSLRHYAIKAAAQERGSW